MTEFHLDAASATATGGHVIFNAKYLPDNNDLAIAKVLEKYIGLWGSSKPTGTYRRDVLLNCNIFSNRGISYCLVEVGFISNTSDVKRLVDNIDAITGELLSEATSSTNAVSKSQTPSDPDKAVAESKAVHQGNAWAKLDKFNEVSKGKVRIAGWLVPDKPEGIKRPDVKKNYGYKGGDILGMDVTVDLSWVKKGTKIDVIFRCCNQANGKSAVNDVRIKEIYLKL